MDVTDFGKSRVFRCSCGRTNCRPLRGEPLRCACGLPQQDMPVEVVDGLVFAQDLIDGTEPKTTPETFS